MKKLDYNYLKASYLRSEISRYFNAVAAILGVYIKVHAFALTEGSSGQPNDILYADNIVFVRNLYAYSSPFLPYKRRCSTHTYAYAISNYRIVLHKEQST